MLGKIRIEMPLVFKIISLLIGLTLLSCSPHFNKEINSSWGDNTTKKRMSYIVEEILLKDTLMDTTCLWGYLELRDSDNRIPFVEHGNTIPERHFRFEKPKTEFKKPIQLKIKRRLQKKLKIVSVEQIEREEGYFTWYYISPVIKIDDFNKNYYDFDMDDFDSFVQVIVNIKIPEIEKKEEGRPKFLYVSSLYIFKSDDKGGFIEHHLVWEGG